MSTDSTQSKFAHLPIVSSPSSHIIRIKLTRTDDKKRIFEAAEVIEAKKQESHLEAKKQEKESPTTGPIDPTGEIRKKLLMAIYNRDIAVVSELTSQCGAALVDDCGPEGGGHCALHEACLVGDFSILEVLLKCCPDINKRDFDGNTPLWFACDGHSSDEFISKLLGTQELIPSCLDGTERPLWLMHSIRHMIISWNCLSRGSLKRWMASAHARLISGGWTGSWMKLKGRRKYAQR